MNTFEDDSKMHLKSDNTNIAIATSSPAPEDDFDFGYLPKVENASVIEPNHGSDHIVKTTNNHEFNIFNKIDDFQEDNIKEDKKTEKVKDVSYLEKNDVHVNINPDDIETGKNIISDDEFFDDFFGD